MDALDKLVQLAQIRGQADVQCRFQGDWQVRHENRAAQALVHIVTDGTGWLQLDGENSARRIQTGDVIFFPRHSAHTLSSAAHCAHENAAPHSQTHGAFTLKTRGSGTPDIRLFCARFQYDEHAILLNSLPDALFLRMQDAQLEPLIALLQNEADHPQQGASAILDALCTLLLVLLLRATLAQHRDTLPAGILKAWQEPRLHAPVQAVLQAPEKPWQIDTLADMAHVSRAQLIRLFKQHMDTTPHAFVLTTRLQKAAHLLHNSQNSILAIALQSGFACETHFGKTFRQHYGQTPGEYRKQGKTEFTEI